MPQLLLQNIPPPACTGVPVSVHFALQEILLNSSKVELMSLVVSDAFPGLTGSISQLFKKAYDKVGSYWCILNQAYTS